MGGNTLMSFFSFSLIYFICPRQLTHLLRLYIHKYFFPILKPEYLTHSLHTDIRHVFHVVQPALTRKTSMLFHKIKGHTNHMMEGGGEPDMPTEEKQ